jgi:ABC-2 type transport system permease protein
MLFSKSIYLAILRRYWAGSALLAIILALNAFTYAQNSQDRGIHDNPFSLLTVIAASIICAALVFSFVNHKRGVVMMHALPVRREALFTSAFLGGLTLLWAPLLFYILLIAGVFSGWAILLWLALTLLSSLFAYSTMVFAGQLTGRAFSQYIIAGMIIGLPIFLELFVTLHFEMFLFGYNNAVGIPLNMEANPYVLILHIIETVLYSWTRGNSVIAAKNIMQIGVVLAFIALLIASSIILYRRRRLEAAGEFIAVKGMRPVFRYGGAFLAAFLFEGLSMAMFYEDKVAMVTFALLGGTIGFIIAEMLIRRTVRVFRHLKGAALFAGCFVVFIIALQLDITGYGRYTPPADKVESIYFSDNSLYLYYSNTWSDDDSWRSTLKPEPYLFTNVEDIATALALQNAIIKERPVRPRTYNHAEGRSAFYFMEATLKSGRTITRYYQVYIANDSSIAELGEALHNAAKPQFNERLLNIGKEARSVLLSWRGHRPYDYDYYYDYDYDPGYLARSVDVPVPVFPAEEIWENLLENSIRRNDIPGFIEAVVLDNEERPRLSYRHDFWSSDLLITATVSRNEQYPGHYRHTIDVHIYDDDHHTLKWLRENGYIR